MQDRFLRACRREAVDRTPVWFMRQAGRSQPEYRALRERYSLLEICRQPELCAEVTLRPVDELGVDAAIVFADITVPLLGMGVQVDLQDGGPKIHRPVRTASDLAALRPFEPEKTVQGVLDAIRLTSRATAVPVIGFAGAPFTLASYLIEGGGSREYAQTKTLMYHHPSLWAGLMDLLTQMTIDYLRAQVASGAKVVQVFDSWVGCLSPVDYARYAAPSMRRIFAALAEGGVPAIHFGTATAGLLEAMATLGGDVIGVDWRIRLDEAWKRIGPQHGIQGNLDPAVLLAPPEVIEERAGEVLRQAAGRRGHIFNLGHGVLPQTPRHHLRRLVDVVHAFQVEDERILR